MEFSPIDASMLPEPMLLLEQLAVSVEAFAAAAAASTLQQTWCKLVRCEGEADLDLARDCAAQNRGAGSTPAYILARDTDFLLHAGVRYVPLESLCLPPEPSPPPSMLSIDSKR